MDKLRVGVIGATGVVGQKFAQLLSAHPYMEIASVYASDRSSGHPYSEFLTFSEDLAEQYGNLEVKGSEPDTIIRDRNDILFSAVSDANAGKLEKQLAEHGSIIMTNASANRLDNTVPLVVPEVNPHHLESVNTSHGLIVANGNCSTIGMALGLAPIFDMGIGDVYVTTLQAVSGAGYPGVPSLDILSNAVPFIKSEEEKMVLETGKIFGSFSHSGRSESELKIHPTCIRVPVREGHLESITAVMSEDADIHQLQERFRNYGNGNLKAKLPTLPDKSVILMNGEDRPQPLLDIMAGSPERAEGMAVTVGRLRVSGSKVSFVLLVNNLIRGAAGSALLNAELLHESGMI
ncbi:MAG: aspartate-semialdehyde dehydrogenase [Thermoplasmataceae archaeon]